MMFSNCTFIYHYWLETKLFRYQLWIHLQIPFKCLQHNGSDIYLVWLLLSSSLLLLLLWLLLFFFLYFLFKRKSQILQFLQHSHFLILSKCFFSFVNILFNLRNWHSTLYSQWMYMMDLQSGIMSFWFVLRSFHNSS